jgi:hypothetical protein
LNKSIRLDRKTGPVQYYIWSVIELALRILQKNPKIQNPKIQS